MATSDEESKAVMHLFRKGRPLTLAQVANKLSWSETKAEWVLTDMCLRGDLVRTKNGKYGLLSKRKEPKPAKKTFRRGELEAGMVRAVGNGLQTAKEIADQTGISRETANRALWGAEKKGLITKIAYGHYGPLPGASDGGPETADPTRMQREEKGSTEPQEVGVSAGAPIVGGIQVNVNITCKSLEEARAVFQALAKSMRGG